MKQKDNFLKGITTENPILISMLGLCPTLAITTSLENALGMGMAIIFVLVLSNLAISLLRKIIPDEIRIPIYIVIIASFVTVIEMTLAAFFPTLSENLSIFIPLIVVNCIILGRAEAFASKNGPVSSMIDGLGMAIGYTLILSLIASIREILGEGTLTVWGNISLDISKLFGSEQKWPIFTTFFTSPAGAYIVLGLLFGIVGTIRYSKSKKKEGEE